MGWLEDIAFNVLEDDDSETGGVIYPGETVRDFAETQREIVLCKDCKHLNDKDDDLLRWCNRLICGTVRDDFFCADGERDDSNNGASNI